MKIKPFLLFLAMTTISCGVFLGENPRSFKYKMKSGETLGFGVSENRFPFTERRTVIVKSGGNYPLKGKDCKDSELKKFSDEIWAEFIKSDELAGIRSGTMVLEKEAVVQGKPEDCYFKYSREDNGEWIQD